ncbi:MAG: ABC transporter substrate-binding protein [Oscillospiraceae bacterium]|nr:ABC transporter substrate-binding protein [Oscillospiraceae bacterium]
MKRLLAMILAVAMVLSCFTACGDTASDSGSTTTAANSTDDTVATDGTGDSEESEESLYSIVSALADAIYDADGNLDTEAYNEFSATVYESALGEFSEAYAAATEASSTSERFALMAIAEAKLLEAAVFIPTNANGGGYGMSKVVWRTIDYTLWGSDADRYHSAVVTNEIITVADRDYLKALWNELAGTGTYTESAKAYLTEQGYTFKDTYTFAYSGDPETFDVLATSQATDSDVVINTYDGLLEYNNEGVQDYALATSYEVSDDGLTYTFHIREGVYWVDSQGRQIAEVTADDWVAAMQHMLDAAGGLEYLVQGIIVGVNEYLEGSITDFSEVGVKAVDTYTLEYTLEEPCSYFLTMFGYSIFAPMSRSYYVSCGGKFGDEYDPSASDYTYGTSPDTIAYCGPYLITNYTASNTIVFSYNESYWNPDGVNVHTITWLYDDGSDTTKNYNDFLAGVVDSTSVTTAIMTLANSDGYTTDNYIYQSSTDATSFMAFYNLYRTATANFNDGTTAVTTLSDEELARTNQAMLNVHFRRALAYSTDRVTYMAQRYGDAIASAAIINSYTPGDFVLLDEDITVDINGTATTFTAGTYYGEIMQAQLTADGSSLIVWDAENYVSSGFDGWYNVDAAVEELEIAIEELAAEGLVIDADNPIHVEFVTNGASETYMNMANAWKQSVEAATDGLIIVDINATDDIYGWYYACYYFSYGYEANFTINTLSGWGPDYGDPSTYLETFLGEYAGYMVKSLGIY